MKYSEGYYFPSFELIERQLIQVDWKFIPTSKELPDWIIKRLYEVYLTRVMHLLYASSPISKGENNDNR